MEINDFIQRFNNTTNSLLQLTRDCSPEQLSAKPGDSWSILEIFEHLYLTDKVIYTILSRPSTHFTNSEEIIGNDRIEKEIVQQRTRKIAAPEFLQPKGKIKEYDVLEHKFLTQRETFKNDILSGKITIDNRVYPHPVLHEMTVSDWLNFAVHHTQRHIEQIKDRRAVR